ncbi:MAG: DUF5655 domain-containing protein [Bacteroidales bacterium]|jgi:predicted transport protein
MKKTKSKKAVSPKKSKVTASKKNQKTTPKVKAEKTKKTDYPSWTMPEHLHESDHKNLKRIYELHKEGKFDVAISFASGLDTIVREEIPLDIWKEIGGTLTNKAEEELKSIKKKEETKSEQAEATRNITHFPHPHVMKNGKLQEFTDEFNINSKCVDEAKFYKKSDLEEFVIENHKTLFGENTVIIDNTKSTNEYFPNMFLFDFKEQDKPRMYVIEVNVSDDSLGLLYARITHFIASLKNKNYQNDFLALLCKTIDADKKEKKELQTRLKEEQDIPGLLSEMLDNRPAILLVKDNENAVLDLMQTVYVETWGKMIRQILVKKYYCNDDTIYNVSPLFANIWKNEKIKKDEIVKCTEEDHLNAVSENIRNIYNEIKTALLETDDTLEFNAKKHYVSVKKNKNLMFFHLRKKNINLVIMNPEDDTRKQIKHHEIKTLPASVQKFWNGACCTLVIENADNLKEVSSLLKKIIVKS